MKNHVLYIIWEISTFLETSFSSDHLTTTMEKYGSEKLIVVRIDGVVESIIDSLKNSGFSVLTNNGNDLTIESTGNNDENQAIIDVVNRAGGKIKSINEVTSSLEDVYIRLVEGEKK